jgi:long-chain acyl-CoA synthetase
MPRWLLPQALDTFPRLADDSTRKVLALRTNRRCARRIWGSGSRWTWHDVAEEVRALACGLAEMGFRRGENLAIVGENRPRMYMMMTAVQCLGGVPLPLYQDAVASEMLFVLLDAEVRFVFVEDQEQVDKVLEIQANCRSSSIVLYDDPRGMRHYTLAVHPRHPRVDGDGADSQPQPSGSAGQRGRAGAADDVSVMLYTSGNDRQAEGRAPDASRLHQRGARRGRFRSSDRR